MQQNTQFYMKNSINSIQCINKMHKTSTHNNWMNANMMMMNYEWMFYVLILGFTAKIYFNNSQLVVSTYKYQKSNPNTSA